MEEKKIRVAITHGDTNGIGYEVIFKTFAEQAMLELCTPIVYGSPKVAAYHRNALGIQANFTIINNVEEAQDGKVNLLATFDEDVKVDLGHPSKEAGTAALKALERAMEDYKKNGYDVLVTAPINKNNIQCDTFNFCGHTEYIQQRMGNDKEALMILAGNRLRVALVTTHLPISEVASAVTKEAIVKKCTIFDSALRRDFNISKPRIAILALNPHAGDAGMIGNEEVLAIKPAMEELETSGIDVFGPFPADGFFGQGQYTAFDGVLAMYHDQGLAPFKTIVGNDGVNITAGLDIIRTSPDHGTAYEIAGKGEADETSFRQAIYTAIDIYRNRINFDEHLQNPLKKLYHERRDDSEKVRFAVQKTKNKPATEQ